MFILRARVYKDQCIHLSRSPLILIHWFNTRVCILGKERIHPFIIGFYDKIYGMINYALGLLWHNSWYLSGLFIFFTICILHGYMLMLK